MPSNLFDDADKAVVGKLLHILSIHMYQLVPNLKTRAVGRATWNSQAHYYVVTPAVHGGWGGVGRGGGG